MRREMAMNAVAAYWVSIALACRAFEISEPLAVLIKGRFRPRSVSSHLN